MSFVKKLTTDLYKGIYLKIAHSIIFTLLSGVLLSLNDILPMQQILFCRFILGSMLAYIFLKLIKQPIPLITSKQSLLFYVVRAVIGFVAMSGWIVGLKNIGVNETIALGYITPVWLMASAVIFFKEKLTVRHVVVVLLNIGAVMLILHPKFATVDLLSVVITLASGLLWTIYNSICKKQTQTDHYIVQCLYTFVFSTIVTLPFALYVWEPIKADHILDLGLLALLGLANVSVLFLAYSYTPLIVLIPFDYLRLLFSMGLSYLLYNTTLTYRFLIGAAVVIATDFYFYISQRNIKQNESSK